MVFTDMTLAGSASDERLIELSSGGSETAFDAIVERYQALLLRHCTRMVGEAAAEDAVQDTLVSAWSALRGGTEVHALRAWLFAIAHRQALSALGDKRGEWLELPESLTDGHSSADAADQSARMHDVLASVAALPDDERDALLQSAVHGGSGRQIAGSLGVDESTVRQLVFRARATLRAAAAAIVTPPLLFARFAHRISGTTHRFGADSRVLRSLSQADTAGRLVRMGATAVAALALVGSGALHAIDVPHQTPLTSHASQRRAATRSVATSRVVRAVRPAATGVRGRSTTSPPAANVLPQPAHPGQSLATNMPQALKGAAQGVFQQVATVAAPVVSQAAAKAVPGAAQSVSSASGGDAAGIVPGVPGL